MIKIDKTKLIYWSKLKSNGIEWKIRKQTCNLTQNLAPKWFNLLSDQGVSFQISKNKIQNSSSEFLSLPQRNLDFKCFLDMKMKLEEEQNKRFNNCVVLKVWLIENPWMFYIVKEGEYE